MSETTQSTVEDFEKEFRTARTDDEKDDRSGVEVMDEHTPILPEADDDGALVPMDEHTPIGPEAAQSKEAADDGK
ncbi:hypothetical protein G4Z16_19710 [Streptomyces bathyalis]|uniref:Uncharacterized protein n=1 Tax=Streptomyces bathyalis TaxID=2710756 RepID=A0A7T1T8E0_9ACTN|nr:hypothetical protein [Streptomyces bathyalis]QPP08253.1 hypothetical protein G4Z16_19710 [Streptomyces bathyalis]